MGSAALCSVLLICAAGCRDKSAARSAPPAPTDADTAPPLATAAGRSHPFLRDAQSPSPVVPTADALAVHVRAIATARTATKKGETDVAIRAFTQALALLPDDPQALGERGFAKLRGGDDAGARADFDRALSLGGSRTLRAQLYFNVGLLAEKQGHVDDARAAYARSRRLHSTPAVAAKLDGAAEPCPLEVTEPPPISTYRSWADALRALQPDASASTEQAARDALRCRDSANCRTLEGGRIAMLANDGEHTLDAVIEEDGQIYVVLGAVARWDRGGFKCPSEIPEMHASIESGILRIDSAVKRGVTECPTGELVDCGCDDVGVHRSASFWNLRARKPVVSVEWDHTEDGPSKSLEVDPQGALTFEGCDLHRRVSSEQSTSAGPAASSPAKHR